MGRRWIELRSAEEPATSARTTERPMPPFRDYLSAFPLVAILRGLKPDNAEAIGGALVEAGFRIIEVPLNSPEPFRSIAITAKTFGPEVLVGAGTVLEPDDVARVREAGGRLVVMPHGDAAVIERAVALGLACTPGVATPTEAFAALRAGAAALKMFPAESLPPAVVKAWRAVLPKDTLLLPVGGIKPDTMGPYVDAGADGFGLGSALFAPSSTAAEVGENARRFASAWEALKARKAA
jgi:2-dehydro-3-deoxyphosphogalactonate aldolase